ncbi:hypothetical protein [Micrococcus terreus]|uniref:hypothetical protein n=1 Tax=Micrococcus terreus TaxID=574650 RepID=UPI003D71B865
MSTTRSSPVSRDGLPAPTSFSPPMRRPLPSGTRMYTRSPLPSSTSGVKWAGTANEERAPGLHSFHPSGTTVVSAAVHGLTP